MTEVGVTNLRSRTIQVSDVELRAPWREMPRRFLSPVTISVPVRSKAKRSHRAYKFPVDPPLHLEVGEVVNYVLMQRKKIPGKTIVDGFLLAIGGKLPPGLRAGQQAELTLTIMTGSQSEYSTNLVAFVERRKGAMKKPRQRILPTSILADLAQPSLADTHVEVLETKSINRA